MIFMGVYKATFTSLGGPHCDFIGDFMGFHGASPTKDDKRCWFSGKHIWWWSDFQRKMLIVHVIFTKNGDFSWDFHGQLHSQLRRRRFRCQVLKSAMASLPSDADVLYLGYSQATLTGQNVGENWDNHELVGGLEHFYFSIYWGIIIPTD